MPKLRVNQQMTSPPDKWRYVFLQDGYLIHSYSYTDWVLRVKQHAINNGYPVPSVEDMEDQVCRTLNGEWCHYEDGTPAGEGISTRFELSDLMNGTKVLLSFIASGAPIVSREVAEERALTCSRCYLNMSIPGCGTCHGIANLVAEACGARKTSSDHLLKACAWCKCSAQANVWIPTEISGAGVSDAMLTTAPSFCWKANSIREERAANSQK